MNQAEQGIVAGNDRTMPCFCSIFSATHRMAAISTMLLVGLAGVSIGITETRPLRTAHHVGCLFTSHRASTTPSAKATASTPKLNVFARSVSVPP